MSVDKATIVSSVTPSLRLVRKLDVVPEGMGDGTYSTT